MARLTALEKECLTELVEEEQAIVRTRIAKQATAPKETFDQEHALQFKRYKVLEKILHKLGR